MAGISQQFIDVLPEMSGFAPQLRRGLDTAKSRADFQISPTVDTKKMLSGVGRGAMNAGKTGGKLFGDTFKGAVGKIALGTFLGNALTGGVKAGMSGLKKLLSDSFAEAAESIEVGKKTEQLIKTTGKAANLSAAQVGKLAESISAKTAVDDEAIQSGANLLLTFKMVRNEVGKGNNVFDRATQAAVDLAATGFGSIEGNSKMLGKALQDPLKGLAALSKAGVTFTEGQKKQIKAMVESGDLLGAQKIILDELEGQVGGVAAASASNVKKMQVSWGNLKEQLGTALMPAFESLAGVINKHVFPAMSKAIEKTEKLKPVFDNTSDAITIFANVWTGKGSGDLTRDPPWMDRAIDIAEKTRNAYDTLASGVSKSFKTIGAAGALLGGGKFTKEIGEALGVKGNSPVVKGILGIRKFFVDAFGNIDFEKVKTDLKRVVDGLQPILAPIGRIVSSAFAALNGLKETVLTNVADLVEEHGPKIAQFFKDIEPGISKLVTGIGDFGEKAAPVIKGIIDEILSALERNGPQINSMLTSLGSIFENLGKVMEKVGPVIAPIIGKVLDTAIGLADAALKVIDGIFTSITGLFSGDQKQINAGLDKVFEGIGKWWETNQELNKSIFFNIAASVFGIPYEDLEKAKKAVDSNFAYLGGSASKSLEDGFKSIGGDPKASTQVNLSNIVAKALAIGGGTIAGNVSNMKKNFDTGWATISGATGRAWDTIKSTISNRFSEAKTNVSNTLGTIGATVSQHWEGLKTNTSNAWGTVKATATSRFNEARTNISNTAGTIGATVANKWEGLKTNTSNTWNTIKSTAATKWNELKTTASNKFGEIKTTITGIWDSLKTSVSRATSAMGKAIGDAFNKIKGAAATPINFVIGTVWNDGLRKMINSIPGVPDFDPAPTIKGYAQGGVLPGWSPGKDIHQFTSATGGRLALSGGEAIMRPEFTRAIGGASGVAALNAAARKGGGAAVAALLGSQNHAEGGLVSFKGGRFTSPFAAALQAVAKKVAFSIFQGGWRPATSYSGTSHQGDAVDAGPVSAKLVRTMRDYGVAAWDRTNMGAWAPHVHGVPVNGKVGTALGSAKWQASDYLNGGNGLNGRDNGAGSGYRPGVTPAGDFLGGFADVFTKLPGQFDDLKKNLDSMSNSEWGTIARQAITQPIRDARNWINEKIPGPGPLPGFASGGIATKGGLASVGERGKETVMLPTGSVTYPNGRVEMQISNWEEGKGWFEMKTRDQINQNEAFNGVMNRQGAN